MLPSNVPRVLPRLILLLIFSLFLSCNNTGKNNIIPDSSDKHLIQRNRSDVAISSTPLITNSHELAHGPGIAPHRNGLTVTRNNAETSPSNKNTFENFVQMGIASFAEKSYSRSVDMFTKAIEINPRVGVVFFHRGNSYLHLRQYESAITDFNMALQFDSGVSQIYNSRGRSYAGKGQHQSAILDFDSAIALNPKDAIPFYNRGSSYQRLGQNEKAILDFNLAIELDSNFVNAYYNRGWAFRELGERDLAALDFDMTCKLKGLMC